MQNYSSKKYTPAVHRKHTHKLFIENINTSCSSKTQTSCSSKTYTQAVHRKHTHKLFIGNIHTSCSSKTYTQAVHRKHTHKLFIKNIHTSCFGCDCDNPNQRERKCLMMDKEVCYYVFSRHREKSRN